MINRRRDRNREYIKEWRGALSESHVYNNVATMALPLSAQNTSLPSSKRIHYCESPDAYRCLVRVRVHRSHDEAVSEEIVLVSLLANIKDLKYCQTLSSPRENVLTILVTWDAPSPIPSSWM